MPVGAGEIRVLLVADSHLGFDHTDRPRVARRRRGDDFFANHARALDAARDVDLVVHAGDLFHRSRVSAAVAERGYAPLRRAATGGAAVILVPGNHERSRLPYPFLTEHPGVHVLRGPRTVSLTVRGVRVAIGGFPYERSGVRRSFRRLVEESGLPAARADVRLLVVHHCFEGARVGPVDYTFRLGDDVVRAADVPAATAAVLTGHVHRSQVLTRDLDGKPLASPVLYPGSIERTSFAEKDERKGYLVATVSADGAPGGSLASATFIELPARPMVVRDLDAGAPDLARRIERAVADAPPDAILRLQLSGTPSLDAEGLLSAARLRALAPPSMNVSVRCAGPTPARRRGSGA